ncbi:MULTISPECIES: class II aldolase/adducin family protein [Pseudoalteromonas]|uniref:Ribulose-5-phosphate 4-epimerase n=1 Tax=Pseudoalteromonas luteoviolacea (strain 2ta16) TaxID=1353533 RepID=V4HSZ4_PSEL2|nr:MULTISPECIES: class II aldolase/adducin family protein [Pseudoalteromonas]ESP92888.1 ribulose-5-phosphate 4-epimerase [Pseudoalteromonas luteoviolacea 2ta16]KZN35700.1 aldolase [Pseudoalteromonas luteoviolacea NCIMB 1944]MCG7546348.1 class II aldolase/adducin family protein [Pseudoalteromonas sp. Of7M-16]
MFDLPELNLKGKVSDEEWKLRVDLAACYRLVEHFRWGDLIYTHMSARLPGTNHYLVNAFGLSFDEVTASNLVKVDLQGNILDDTPYEINPAGFTIHSAIHEVREDAHCVIHLHTKETIAVASLEGGLQPLSQHSMFSLPSLSYHGYEGLAVNDDERARLQADLGNTNHMLLVNHGGLTLGPTVGDAFMRFYDLQRACEIQVAILATGQPAIAVPQPIQDNIYNQAKVVHSGSTGGQLAWPAMLRKAYRLDPGFAK